MPLLHRKIWRFPELSVLQCPIVTAVMRVLCKLFERNTQVSLVGSCGQKKAVDVCWYVCVHQQCVYVCVCNLVCCLFFSPTTEMSVLCWLPTDWLNTQTDAVTSLQADRDEFVKTVMEAAVKAKVIR